MAYEETRRLMVSPESARVLARECGVTEQQIREIISLVGMDRASIVREARFVARNGS